MLFAYGDLCEYIRDDAHMYTYNIYVNRSLCVAKSLRVCVCVCFRVTVCVCVRFYGSHAVTREIRDLPIK